MTKKLSHREFWNRQTQRNAAKREREMKNAALVAYNFAAREEDRFVGSVFAGMSNRGARLEAQTQAAYERCIRLGVERGL